MTLFVSRNTIAGPNIVRTGENTLEAARQAALAAAWAEGTLPGGAGTKSAKEWANTLAAANTDTINAGKPFPLKSATRNGTTSSENTNWSNLILNAFVIGAEAGKVYSLQRQNNEATTNAFGWAINEYVESAMASTNNAVVIMAITDTAPTIDRANAKQTIVIAPPLRPKLRIILTIDGTKLPAAGTAINSNSSSTALGYSWIIDPSCYSYAASQNRLAINAWENYPVMPMTRDGYTTAQNDFLNRVLLDIKVKGARKGCYYQVGYIANDAVIGTANYGVLIYEFDAATYATASVARIVQNYTTSIPELTPAQLNRSATELTFSFVPTGRPEMVITMTIDPSKLPASGTAINMISAPSTTPAKSWIIHPACYDYAQEPAELGRGGVHILAVKSSRSLTLSWRESATQMRRVVWSPATCNGLWTMSAEFTAPLGDPVTANWTLVYSGGSPVTDWLPPLQVTANASGDGSTSGFFTGGNHDSTGGATGGTATASVVQSRVLIDGRDLDTFTGPEVSIYASEVVLDFTADLMGWNTVSLARNIVRQHFNVRLFAGGASVHCTTTALEAITVWTDYGPQMTSLGYRDGLHFWEGQQAAKIEPWFGTAYTSGDKATYPTACIQHIRGGTNYRVSWVDPSYGLGDGSAVGSTLPRMFCSTSGKIYHGIVRSASVGTSGGKSMAAGESYSWRGGYAWGTSADWSGVEAAFRRLVGRKVGYAAIFASAGSGVVKAITDDVDRVVGGVTITPDGIVATATGYDALTWTEA